MLTTVNVVFYEETAESNVSWTLKILNLQHRNILFYLCEYNGSIYFTEHYTPTKTVQKWLVIFVWNTGLFAIYKSIGNFLKKINTEFKK